MHRSLALVALPALLALGPTATRAETFHTCAGFIDSVPAVITSQGVWCLRGDLATSLSSTTAIAVQANNVTIDCNGFKIGGLGAGPDSTSAGIGAVDRRNLTVRNCNIRGFNVGIGIQDFSLPEGGHVVEDNTIETSYWLGVWVQGMDNVVRRNRIRDVGGSQFDAYSAAIETRGTADIQDNTIAGVSPSVPFWEPTDGDAYAINTYDNAAGSITGNRIRDLFRSDLGEAVAIHAEASGRILVAGNHLANPDIDEVNAVQCDSAVGLARDNTIMGFAGNIDGCTVGTGNAYGQ